MFTKIAITLKTSGKVIEVFVEGGYEVEKIHHHSEWLTIRGFELHPFESPKTVTVCNQSIGAVEITPSADWSAESVKSFKESLSK